MGREPGGNVCFPYHPDTQYSILFPVSLANRISCNVFTMSGLRFLRRQHAAATPASTRSLRYFSEKSESFIDRARVKGANALLGTFIHEGKFDACMRNLVITKIEDGYVTCSCPVDATLQNAYNTLHGGATSTIVDIVGTLALLSQDPTRPGVSVEMNTSFIGAAKSGEVLEIEGRVLKSGRKLGFTQVDIKRADGALVATGRHTKFLG